MPHARRLLPLTLACACCLPALAQATPDETHRGQLDENDPTLERGESYDTYRFVTTPGQRLTVDLTSDDFDTYLALVSPSNVLYRLDDYQNSPAHTRFDSIDLVGGTWTIVATSTQITSGDYVLQVRARDAALGSPVLEAADALENGDTIERLHFVDRHTVTALQGDRLLIDLTARRFDTRLRVTLPDGSVLENDDYLDAINHSRLTVTAPSDGDIRIEVSAYDPEGEGRYELQAWTLAPAGE